MVKIIPPKSFSLPNHIPAEKPSLSTLVEEVERVWKKDFPEHYRVAEGKYGIFGKYKTLAKDY